MDRPHALLIEHDQRIEVVFDRDEKLNAIDEGMWDVIRDATRRLATSPDLRCLVISAKGRYFTAGIDVRDQAGISSGDPDATPRHPGWNFRRNYRSNHLLYDELEAVEKPIIVAIQGPCLGAGLQMALSCDFRFCSERAEFSLPEVKLGAVPGSGGTSRLTTLVGPGWAKYFAMTGATITSETAMRIGLVQEVLPEEELDDRVQAFCDTICALPAEAVGLTKLAVNLATDVDRSSMRVVERLANTHLLAGPPTATGSNR